MALRVIQAGLSLLIMAVVVVFAVMNRGDIAVSLTPLHPPFTWPLYAVILLSLFFGFMAGAAIQALFGLERSKIVREQRRAIKRLERELDEARSASLLPAPLGLTDRHGWDERDHKRAITAR